MADLHSPKQGECWIYTNFDYMRTHWKIIDVIDDNVLCAQIIAHDGWNGISPVGTISDIGTLDNCEWSLCKKHRFYALLKQILEAEKSKE